MDAGQWKLSGTDMQRNIEHYYHIKSVATSTNGVVRMKTRGVHRRGGNSLEKETGVAGADYFETTMVMHCREKYVAVLVIEYYDRRGGLLKREDMEQSHDEIRPINEQMPLFGAYKDLCR